MRTMQKAALLVLAALSIWPLLYLALFYMAFVLSLAGKLITDEVLLEMIGV